MPSITISQLAFIWLLKCDGGASLDLNSTSGQPQEGCLQPTIAFNTLRPNTSISIRQLHPTSSLNGTDVLVGGSETFPTFTASTTISDARDPSVIQYGADSDGATVDHVDFDQWLNLDGYKDENNVGPSRSMLWDRLDYGPPDELSNKDATIESLRFNATSWNSSYTTFESEQGRADPDMALNSHHTDSSNDRPGSPPVGVDACLKPGCSESLDPDSHLEARESFENISVRWLQHLRASNKRSRSDERSKSEDDPFFHESSLLSTLGIGAAAFLEHLSEGNRSRKRAKNSSSKDAPTEVIGGESSRAHDPSIGGLYRRLASLAGQNTIRQLLCNSRPFPPTFPLSIPRRLSHFETIIENSDSQGAISGSYETVQHENVDRGSRRSVSTEQESSDTETRPISQEQLVSEVKGIYTGLAMVESKCIEMDSMNASFASPGPGPEPHLNNEQWQALIALHRTLLPEHHDFFLASQHPPASPALRRLAERYSMPLNLRRHGIHSFCKLLGSQGPNSPDHMRAFRELACSMMRLRHEEDFAFEDTWLECLGDLGKVRMSIDDDDIRDREIWTGVAREWTLSSTLVASPTATSFKSLSQSSAYDPAAAHSWIATRAVMTTKNMANEQDFQSIIAQAMDEHQSIKMQSPKKRITVSPFLKVLPPEIRYERNCENWTKAMPSNAPNIYSSWFAFSLKEVISPFRLLRRVNAMNFKLCDGDIYELEGVLEIKSLVESTTTVDRVFQMYQSLLKYAQAFERNDDIKSQMTTRWTDSYEPFIFRNRSYHNVADSWYRWRCDFSSSRQMRKFPVEGGLKLAKFASDENDINDFKIQRKAVVDRLESQYKRVISADEELMSFANQQQFENGMHLSTISTHHPNVKDKAITEGTVILNKYADSFKRDGISEIDKPLKPNKSIFDSLYRDTQRGIDLLLVADAARARDWDAWKTHFRNVIKDTDRQYLQIRAARKELFKYDTAGTDPECHVDFPGWDADINWSELIL
ncbi:hypothetical protein EG329_006890 [Mollisiaceae sp. DMI_Dod_QoI]|nr:hypothetical protein EG329_006890 [Helotiales sp. DMI_Dod_QoI]